MHPRQIVYARRCSMKSKYFIPVRLSILICILVFAISPASSVLAVDRPSPAVTNKHYIEPDGDGAYPCYKNDPCNFNIPYLFSAIGDIFIFKEGTYTKADMGYSDPTLYHHVIDLDVKILHLYGGWDGNPALDVDPVINPSLYQTILNGEYANRVIRVSGSGNTSTIAGFLITAGYAENSINNHCTASGMSTGICGGGIYVDEASPSIHDNILSMNIAVNKADKQGAGGGIYAYNSNAVQIFDNDIIGNSANSTLGTGFGGGVYLFGCGDQTRVHDNVIRYNSAAQDPNLGWGAGIVIEQGDSVQFYNNQVKLNNQDGPPNMIGSGLMVFSSTLSIHDNQFTDNQPWSVVELYNSLVDFQGNYIKNPEAAVGLNIISGGTLGTTTVVNNMILHQDYANVRLEGSSTNYANVAFYFNTVAFNATGTADRGYVIGNYVTGLFSHGIVADQYYGFYNDGHINGTIDIGYYLMYDDTHEYDSFGYVHSFSGNPLFVDPVNGDYHIQINSAAKDKGPGYVSVPVDFDHQRRPNASTTGWTNPADLGADEYCLPRYFPFIKK
jgi:hypothetical protein